MVSRDHKLSVRRQCGLLSRSNLYYQPKGESAENLRFMGIIDRQFLQAPWYGSRQMARFMQREGHKCGRHRVRRLMKLMRLVPIYHIIWCSKSLRYLLACTLKALFQKRNRAHLNNKTDKDAKTNC